MTLFIILSVFVVLLIALLCAIALSKRIPGGLPTRRYLIAGTLGTVIGFMLANACVALAGIGPLLFAQTHELPQWLNYTGAVMVAGILLLGPIVASVIGVVAGFAGGLYFTYKRQRRLQPPAEEHTEELTP